MVKTQRKKKKNLLRAVFIISFMIVPVISFLLFYVYTNISGFFMAFQKPDGLRYVFNGFENFKWVFEKIFKSVSDGSSEDLKIAFINTFKTFGLNMIMFLIGFMVSYFIYKKILGYKSFRVIFYVPAIISPIVVSYFYQEFVNSNFFSVFLQKLFNMQDPVEAFNTRGFANAMIFMQIFWLSFPANIILWGGAFSRIPTSLIESAKIDGVNWIQELFHIIVPLVWPTFVLLVVTNLAGVFGASGNVFLLTQGRNGTQTVSNWMYMMIQMTPNPYASSGIYNKVSAMGFMLTIISCFIAFLTRKFMNSRIGEVEY